MAEPARQQNPSTTEDYASPKLEVIQGGKGEEITDEPASPDILTSLQPLDYFNHLWRDHEQEKGGEPADRGELTFSVLKKLLRPFGGKAFWEKIVDALQKPKAQSEALQNIIDRGLQRAETEKAVIQNEIKNTPTALATAAERIGSDTPDISADLAQLETDLAQLSIINPKMTVPGLAPEGSLGKALKIEQSQPKPKDLSDLTDKEKTATPESQAASEEIENLIQEVTDYLKQGDSEAAEKVFKTDKKDIINNFGAFLTNQDKKALDLMKKQIDAAKEFMSTGPEPEPETEIEPASETKPKTETSSENFDLLDDSIPGYSISGLLGGGYEINTPAGDTLTLKTKEDVNKFFASERAKSETKQPAETPRIVQELNQDLNNLKNRIDIVIQAKRPELAIDDLNYFENEILGDPKIARQLDSQTLRQINKQLRQFETALNDAADKISNSERLTVLNQLLGNFESVFKKFMADKTPTEKQKEFDRLITNSSEIQTLLDKIPTSRRGAAEAKIAAIKALISPEQPKVQPSAPIIDFDEVAAATEEFRRAQKKAPVEPKNPETAEIPTSISRLQTETEQKFTELLASGAKASELEKYLGIQFAQLDHQLKKLPAKERKALAAHLKVWEESFDDQVETFRKKQQWISPLANGKFEVRLPGANLILDDSTELPSAFYKKTFNSWAKAEQAYDDAYTQKKPAAQKSSAERPDNQTSISEVTFNTADAVAAKVAQNRAEDRAEQGLEIPADKDASLDNSDKTTKNEALPDPDLQPLTEQSLLKLPEVKNFFRLVNRFNAAIAAESFIDAIKLLDDKLGSAFQNVMLSSNMEVGPKHSAERFMQKLLVNLERTIKQTEHELNTNLLEAEADLKAGRARQADFKIDVALDLMSGLYSRETKDGQAKIASIENRVSALRGRPNETEVSTFDTISQTVQLRLQEYDRLTAAGKTAEANKVRATVKSLIDQVDLPADEKNKLYAELQTRKLEKTPSTIDVITQTLDSRLQEFDTLVAAGEIAAAKKMLTTAKSMVDQVGLPQETKDPLYDRIKQAKSKLPK